MPSLVVPNTVQVELIWQISNVDSAVNVLHYIVPSGFVVDSDSVAGLSGSVAAAFGAGTPSYRANCAAAWKLSRVTLRDVRVANQAKLESPVNLAGTGSSDLLPAQVAACVTLRTALAGPSYRGRTYLSGWAEGTSDVVGRMNAGVVNSCLNFMGAMNSHNVTSSLMVLGVLSRKNLSIQPVTSRLVRDLIWDTQRRRAYEGI